MNYRDRMGYQRMTISCKTSAFVGGFVEVGKKILGRDHGASLPGTGRVDPLLILLLLRFVTVLEE